MSNSTINKNMVYIKDILIKPYGVSEKFIDPHELEYSQYDGRSG